MRCGRRCRPALLATRSGSPTSAVAAGHARTRPTASPSAAVASWEIDLWGQLAQASSGAQAGYQASADDLAAARLSAQATLAQTYFLMRTAEIQQSLLERTAQGYQRALDLTQIRYEGGIAARTDVLLAADSAEKHAGAGDRCRPRNARNSSMPSPCCSARRRRR